MKTDSIFYRLFKTKPSLLFELTEVSLGNSEQYQFNSVEIKQTSFRIDGLFIPPENDSQSPIFFVEVQFRPELDFYSRFFAEIFLYLHQYQPVNPWQAVVIYPKRSIEIGKTQHYTELIDSSRVTRLYLDELEDSSSSLSVSLVQLVVVPKAQAIKKAKNLVTTTKQSIPDRQRQLAYLDLIETIIVYKLPTLTRDEIRKMLEFPEIDVKQTRFYQDVFAEGRQEEGLGLVLRLLTRRFGQLQPNIVTKVQSLSLSDIEALAEALLDFSSVTDLENWLQEH